MTSSYVVLNPEVVPEEAIVEFWITRSSSRVGPRWVSETRDPICEEGEKIKGRLRNIKRLVHTWTLG